MYLSKYASLTSDCPKWFNACRNTFSEQPDFFSKRQKIRFIVWWVRFFSLSLQPVT